MQSIIKKYKSWVEISSDNLLHNLDLFQKFIGEKTKVAAVVKANAYGHGLSEVVSILSAKVDFFAVDNANEAIIVRKINKKAGILVLGYVQKTDISKLIKNNISFVVFNKKILNKIVKLNLRILAKIHLKIETGLNRLGFSMNELTAILSYLDKHSKKILLEGVYTHFSNIEDTADPSFTYQQLSEFQKALDLIRKEGFKPKYIHSAASGATLLYPQTHFSMVRVGISLYGLWPSEENRVEITKKNKSLDLLPVMTWKSLIVQLKEVKKGESVGYGRSWWAKRKSKIAIVPVGYSDGYDRGLSNCGTVCINHQQAKVIGRIAMNMFMIDVTNIKNIKNGDEVTLLGQSSCCEVSVDKIAAKIGTISYEVISRINPNLPRVII